MKGNILQKKWYLYLTEFFAGMSVMAVELGASRLLAPYFSSSQIVWTIIIGIIMIAMALGNMAGGRWADREKDPAKLFRRIAVAATWIALIPLAGKYVIVGITGLLVVTVSTNLLIWAALAACIILFVFPLFLLGTVTPSLIRYTVSDLDESGRVAGRLGACNTVGSILGTFLPTFVTIPAVGTSMTFLLFSAVLLILALLYFAACGGGRILAVVCALLYLLSALFGHASNFAFWEKDLAYEGESVYNYLQVRDGDRATALSTNVLFGVQSLRMKNEKLTGMYYDYDLAAPVMAGREDPSVLVLGMGTGTFASQCRDYFPECRVCGVEIDEKITALAYEYFDLSRKIPVYTYDGRAFLQASGERYDVILVDAYQDLTIPFQMSTAEFFALVRDHLTDNGILAVNMSMHGQTGEEDIAAWLSDTIRSVFGDAWVCDVSGSTNRELFAAKNGSAAAKLEENLETVSDGELLEFLSSVCGALEEWQGVGRIFTDDKAPVELLGMKTLDGIIREEAAAYRESFRKEGLAGLLKNGF